jgi:uncharacterized protein YifN (PemK superfamily)
LGSRCDHVGIANPMFFYRTKNPIMIYSRGIKFAVGVGTVLLCDYNRGGFQPPQMVKLRPAVVISPRLPYRDGHESERQVDYVARVEFPQPLPYPFPYKVFWAKCDMMATVSFGRLDLFHQIERGVCHGSINPANS